jgi:hypothetical protein
MKGSSVVEIDYDTFELSSKAAAEHATKGVLDNP